MAVKLEFDHANVVCTPTIVLAKKSGKKLGAIPATSIAFDDSFNSMNTITFKVNRENNGVKTRLWDEIKNFKLIWCKEWDAWFEIEVKIDESDELVKNIEGHSIGESELSAIKLYEIQINTEEDIELDDYVPTVLYDSLNPSASLLDRIMEKAPHYTIKHVDATIASIQRTFSFNDKSLLDAFYEIGEEIGCIFILSQTSDDDGYPERGVYVYDLMCYCQACGHREDNMSVCPECGGTNIRDGYGLDTNVFVSNENLAKEITLTTDISSVNNCFRLEAGDELMTATVKSCNPNGSEYLWHITDEVKSDMSDELVEVLEDYDEEYEYYQTEYQTSFGSTLLSNYNTLVTKYVSYNSDLQSISNTTGFSALINAIYNTIDFNLFLTSGLMPTPSTSTTNAPSQAALLTASALSPLAVASMTSISKATVDSNALAYARALVKSTYRVSIKTSTFSSPTWTGTFTVENYSDEEDVADSSSITITVTDDYEKYVEQKLNKLLNKENDDNYDVTGLFAKTLTVSGGVYSGDFANELKKYCLNSLKSFHESCQSCIDVLSEEGVSDAATWLNSSPNLYNQFYKDYFRKLKAIESEMKLRQTEINTIQKLYTVATKVRNQIQEALDFKAYIGTTLWKEFCSYRRETTYSNSNYISDGLTNTEVLSRAKEFITLAQNELVKAATLQHSISTTLSNLLVIKEFQPIVHYFKVGNWIRVRIDGKIYKLRLIGYSIDFDELDELSVEFSDVINCGDDISDLQSVLKQANAMATSYESVERQASNGEETSKTVKSWFSDGLDATLTRIMSDAENQNMTFDNHGLLMRRFDDVSETYYDEQLRIVNSTILITDDNWESTKTAIGKFFYVDPSSGTLKTAFGINGETIIGRLILGENLGIYNSANSMKFNSNGLEITNSTNTFKVNPNATKLISLLKGSTEIFSVNTSGDLAVKGAITATTLATGSRTSSATGTAGTFIDSNGAIYVGSTNAFTVTSAGVLTATGATVSGAITATTLSTGSRTSASTGTAGTFINSSGAIYVGDNNQTVISAAGKITTRDILIYGSDDNTSCSIKDELIFTHNDSATDVRLARFREYQGKVNNEDIYKAFQIWGDQITFSETNNSSWSLVYAGQGTAQMTGSLEITGSITTTTAGHIGTNLYVGEQTSTGTGIIEASGQLKLVSNSVSLYLSKDYNVFAPVDNNATALGGSEHRWTTLYATNGTINTSDAKEKDILGKIDFAEELIMSLSPKTFMWKDGDHRRKRMGFVAQDVNKVCKGLKENLALVTASYKTNEELGDKDKNYKKSYLGEEVDDNELVWGISYAQLIAPMIQVIQNLRSEVNELKQQLNTK